MMGKIFMWAGIAISILLIPTAFIIGNFIGGLKNAKPMLNNCIETKEIPFKNYTAISVGRFDDMYRLFYGDKYKFYKIITPNNVTFVDYYGNLRFEYFFTEDGKMIACGIYK